MMRRMDAPSPTCRSMIVTGAVSHAYRMFNVLLLAAGALTSSRTAHHPPKLSHDAAPIEGRWTDVTATVTLPVSPEEAFSLYAQLHRHPAWSPWLRSVENATEIGAEEARTRWVLSVPGGIRVAWLARTVDMLPPKQLGWESVSGVRQRGIACFTRTAGGCELTVRISYRAPAVLRSVPALDRIIRRVLQRSLVRFRAILVDEVVRTVDASTEIHSVLGATGSELGRAPGRAALRPWTWARRRSARVASQTLGPAGD